jgi:hypothetical protein
VNRDSEADGVKTSLQKTVLGKVVAHLGALDEGLYYASTMVVSHEAYKMIHEGNFLSRAEKELVENLPPHDIQILISYSNCC